MKRAGFAVLFLTGVYAMVLASFHPWDLFFGVVFSGALVYAFRSFVFGGQPDPLTGLARRCAAFFPFVVAVVWDVLKGTWEVALITLHLKPLVEPGVVKLPVGERTPTGVAVLGTGDDALAGSVPDRGERRVHADPRNRRQRPGRVSRGTRGFLPTLSEKVFP
jgi:multisubunit Na+/H+ antiporter MnhE subunit